MKKRKIKKVYVNVKEKDDGLFLLFIFITWCLSMGYFAIAKYLGILGSLVIWLSLFLILHDPKRFYTTRKIPISKKEVRRLARLVKK